jgi:hypothetical protein
MTSFWSSPTQGELQIGPCKGRSVILGEGQLILLEMRVEE